MASAVLAALKHAPNRSVFNIVDAPLREGEYLDRLADSLGVPRPARDETKLKPPSWRCSNRAAQSILHWSPTHSLIP